MQRACLPLAVSDGGLLGVMIPFFRSRDVHRLPAPILELPAGSPWYPRDNGKNGDARE